MIPNMKGCKNDKISFGFIQTGIPSKTLQVERETEEQAIKSLHHLLDSFIDDSDSKVISFVTWGMVSSMRPPDCLST